MPVAVHGKLMSTLVDLLDQIRVALDAFPNQVEGGTYLVPLQYLQQARRIPRVWTVVKGQRDLVVCFFTQV